MRNNWFKTIFPFSRFLIPQRRQYFFILFLTCLSIAVSLVYPILSKFMVDKALLGRDSRAFLVLALLAAVIFLFGEAINRLKSALEKNVRMKVHFEISKKAFIHLQCLPLRWFQDQSTGEQLYRVHFDIDQASEFISNFIPELVSIVIRSISILALVFYLEWRLALASLLLAPFLYLPPYLYKRTLQDITEKFITASERIFRYLQEYFSHVLLVKAYGKESKSVEEFLLLLEKKVKVGMKAIKFEEAMGFITELGSKAIVGGISLYGGYLVIRGRISPGSLTAIIVYFAQLINLHGQCASLWQNSFGNLLSCSRLNAIWEAEDDGLCDSAAREYILKEGAIGFKGVSFGYRPGNLVLNNISFSIEGGSHSTVAGASGCGKTTLMYLLLRLFEPGNGSILIDGADSREMKVECLRRQVGVALQEPLLWDASISNNIRYAQDDASPDEVRLVCALCGIEDFARALPQGLDTLIGENACKLSEGQKQRVALARALIKRPKILILDEAMASMDSASEEKIIANIKSHYPEMTLITVSHRLSTVMASDAVYYLAGPDQMIIDSPRDLLTHNAQFGQLFGQQKDV